MSRPLKIAYLSLQQVAEGLDSWAAVNEVIVGLEAEGIHVDRWFPDYGETRSPGILARAREMYRLQRRLSGCMGEYDALYVRGHPLAYLAARTAAKRRMPVVQECNGMYEDVYIAWPIARPFRGLIDRMQAAQYSWAQKVVCVTPELASWVQAEAPGAKTEVVPNGVNTDIFCPDRKAYPGLPSSYAVFFGNLAPWQGIDVLLEAFEEDVWPPELTLVIVGDGAMRGLVESAAGRNPDRLVYLEHVPYAEIGSIVANARLSLIPINSPEREKAGFSPLKLYESMACGTPVVVADTGGLGELVENTECGFAFPPGDARSLAETVAEVSTRFDVLSEVGEKARAAALSECSWRARAAARASILRELAGA